MKWKQFEDKGTGEKFKQVEIAGATIAEGDGGSMMVRVQRGEDPHDIVSRMVEPGPNQEREVLIWALVLGIDNDGMPEQVNPGALANVVRCVLDCSGS